MSREALAGMPGPGGFVWSWALLGVFFCFLSSFFRFFDAYYVILHFCGDFRLFVFDFWRFGEGVGKDFERILKGFLVIFSKCFENCDLAKSRVFLEKTNKIKGWRHETYSKNHKKMYREFVLKNESGKNA